MAEANENTPNKNPLRVSNWLMEEIKDTKRAWEKHDRRVYTNAEILDWAWKEAKKQAGKNPIVFPAPDTLESKTYRETFSTPVHRRLLEMLAKILNSGVHDAIGAVTQNLEVFEKYIEGEVAEAKRESGSSHPRRGKK
jgi:hypothetical protein